MNKDIVKRLEALADPRPQLAGFHLGMRDNHNAIELEFGQMLMGCVIDRQPEVVLELGTGPGYSGAWILAGLDHNRKGHLYTLDPVPANPSVWETAGCPTDRLTYLNELSHEIADKLPAQIDILFHDASHDFNDIKRDLDLFLPRLPVRGVVMVHDVNFRRNMGDLVQKYFDEKAEEFKYEEISSGCGMGIGERIK